MTHGNLASDRQTAQASQLFACGAVCVLVVCISLGFAPRAHATTGLTIQPVKVSYTINPGGSVTDTILLKNAGGDAEVYESVQDFIPTAGSSGIEFIARAPGVTSVRDWVTVTTVPEFSLKVGEQREITFTVTVPKDAEPGSHFGGIFFKAVDQASATQQLKVGTQIGMLVLVTVPGNRLQRGKIDSFSTKGFIQKGPVDFVMSFENTGTVYFEPKGEIDIKNIFGGIVGKVPIQGQVVLPTGVRDITAQWPSNFLLGPYSADATVYDGEGNMLTTQTIKFFALPIWYILTGFDILIVIYIVLVFLKRRVKFSVSIKK